MSAPRRRLPPEQRPLVELLLGATATDPARRPPRALTMADQLRGVPLAPDPEGERPVVFDQIAGLWSAEPDNRTAPEEGPRPKPAHTGPARTVAVLVALALLCLVSAAVLLLA